MTVATEQTVTRRQDVRPPATPAGQFAALRAIERNTIRLSLPAVGIVTLPSAQHLAWYGGIATVAALGFIEWPVAAILAVGHLLAEDHHHRLLHDFGEALSEA